MLYSLVRFSYTVQRIFADLKSQKGYTLSIVPLGSFIVFSTSCRYQDKHLKKFLSKDLPQSLFQDMLTFVDN